jgi:hypothetical protein
MKRVLFAAAILAVLSIGANTRDDRLPANFVGDWCFASIPRTIWHFIVAVAAPIPTMLMIG